MSKVEINRERFYTGGPFNTGLTNLGVIHKDKKIKMMKERNIYPSPFRPQTFSSSTCTKRKKLKTIPTHRLQRYGTSCQSDHLTEVKTMRNTSLGPRKR